MIKIESKKNKFTYNVYHVTKAFYPKEDIVQTVDEKQEPLVKIHLPEGTCFSLAPEECVQTEDVQEEKRNVTKKVYQFLSKQTGQELAWGMLTGVRQTKNRLKLYAVPGGAKVRRFILTSCTHYYHKLHQQVLI